MQMCSAGQHAYLASLINTMVVLCYRPGPGPALGRQTPNCLNSQEVLMGCLLQCRRLVKNMHTHAALTHSLGAWVRGLQSTRFSLALLCAPLTGMRNRCFQAWFGTSAQGPHHSTLLWCVVPGCMYSTIHFRCFHFSQAQRLGMVLQQVKPKGEAEGPLKGR